MEKDRLFGLDILRAIAVMMVVFGHSVWLLYGNIPHGTLLDSMFIFLSSTSGFVGVEIFFVLSGFLIGNIFIKEFQFAGVKTNLSRLVRFFWIKRWFRTIPNYYLYIFIYISAYLLLDKAIYLNEFSWKYILFLQNFLKAGPGFLGVAWSLSVEEWFYLFLPITFTLFFWVTSKPKLAIKTTFLLLLVVPFLLRLAFVVLHPNQQKLLSVFSFVTIYRLDSIAYGTLLVWFWNKEKLKQRMIFYKKQLFWTGLISQFFFLLFLIFSVYKPDQNPFITLLTFPWATMSIVLIFPFMITYKNKNHNLSTKIIYFISIISYSLYLAHPIMIVVGESLIQKFNQSNVFFINVLLFFLVIILSFCLASVTYYLCEKPFLRLRGEIINKL